MKSLAPLLVVLTLASGCRGPSEDRARLKLNIDPGLLTKDFSDGARRDATQADIRRAVARFTTRLFDGEPMPKGVPEGAAAANELNENALAERLRALSKADPAKLGANRKAPEWSGGVPAPPRAADHDLPRPYPVVVRQGERLSALARWAGTTREAILADNHEHLGRRKYLRSGDRLMLTMSPNQKVAFDQAREHNATERLNNYFATRYVAKVIVYRVKRGESIAEVAARYGEVPSWLLAEFNPMDFRRVRPGTEILIPVIEHYDQAEGLPPALRVVDEEGAPLDGTRRERVTGKIGDGLLGRARMAIDDSNVFERTEHPRGRAAGAVLPNYGRIGAPPTVPVAQPRPAPPAVAVSPRPSEAEPQAPTTPPVKVRSVLVKKRETLGHYAAWSGLSLREIKRANPGLNPDLIFIGKKVKLPMDDDTYAAFVQRRAEAFLSPAEKRRRAEQARNAERREAQRRAEEAQRAADAAAAHAAALNGTLAPATGTARGASARAAAKPAVAPGAHVGSPAGGRALVAAAIQAPTAAPGAHGSFSATARVRYYKVAPGDIASRIARRKGTTLSALRRLNPGLDLDRLRIGQKVRIR